MKEKLHQHRFEAFLATQCLVLFGVLIFPFSGYQTYLFPVLLLLNQVVGLFFLRNRIKTRRVATALLVCSAIFSGYQSFARQVGELAYQELPILGLLIYSVFYGIISIEIFRQVWRAETVDKKTIFGMVSGYLLLGMVGFFIFAGVEIYEPGSFSVMSQVSTDENFGSDTILYYAFITLLAIGYGEIAPLSAMAQKAAMLVGLSGHFFTVIFTGVIVGKFLSRKLSSSP